MYGPPRRKRKRKVAGWFAQMYTASIGEVSTPAESQTLYM